MRSEEYIEEFDDRKRYMSEKQAAYCLRHFHDGGCEVCQYAYEIRCDIALARAIAIKCVEMQIPKNPVITDSGLLHCVNCGHWFDEPYEVPFCPECGQAQDWSDEE